MMNEKITLANEQIKKVVEYLKEHESAFYFMNLKLYNASYYEYSSDMKKDFPLCYKNNMNDENSYFYDFCDTQYMFFKEDLNYQGIDFDKMYHQLGMTSSFYLHDGNIIDVNRNGINYDYTVENAIYNFYNDNYCEILNNKINNEIVLFEIVDKNINHMEDIENELDYIINDLYNDIEEYCRDIIIVYSYIKDFKENQIKYFKEYLQCEEEKLQEELEERGTRKATKY